MLNNKLQPQTIHPNGTKNKKTKSYMNTSLNYR